MLLQTTFIPSGAFSDTENSPYREAIEVLSGLSVISGYNQATFMPDAKIKRSEFASMITKLTGFEAENNEASTETPFDDIDPGYWANNFINYVASMGYMNGDGKNFFPEREITVDEVQKVIVELLGHGFKATDGGYPAGYRTAGNQLGIYKGVSSGYSEPATRGEVAQMLYNCIDTRIFVRNAFGGDKITYTEGGSYLKEFMDIDTVKGILTDDGNSGISGESTLAPGMIRIKPSSDADVYAYAGEVSADGLLGLPVVAYIKKDNNDEYSLLYIRADEGKLKTVTVEAERYEGFYGDTVSYFAKSEEDGATREIRILPSADVIYNGIYYDGDKAEILDISSGSITFADTERDGIYDLIKIEEKEYIIVDAVSSVSGIIVDKYSSANNIVADPDNSDVVVEVIKYNQPFSMSVLSTGDVVEVVRSKNTDGRKYIRLTVIDNSVTGTATSIDDNEVTIDGTPYKLSSYYKDNINEIGSLSLNTSTTFLLDADGKVMAASDTVSSYKYGYLTGAAKRSEHSDATVRIFTSGGKMEDYVLSDKLILDGKSKGTYAELITNLSFAKYGTSSTAKNIGQLVRYKLSPDNLIIGIDTARTNTVTDSEQAKDELSRDREGEFKWLSGPRSFDGTLMGEDAIFFGIPDDPADYGKYVIYQAAGLPNSKYQVYLYNIDDIGIAKAAVVVGSSVAEFENDDPIHMIKKISASVDEDGSPVYLMYTVECKTMSEKQFRITEDTKIFEYMTYSLPSYFSPDLTEMQKLKPGDVIRVSANMGVAAKIERLLSISNLKKNQSAITQGMPLEGEIAATGTANVDYSYLLRFVTGRLQTRKDRYIKLGVINTSDGRTESGLKELSYFLQDTAKFVIYTENRSGSSSVKTGNISEMKDAVLSGSDASYIFVKSRYGVLQEIFVFNFSEDPWN